MAFEKAPGRLQPTVAINSADKRLADIGQNCRILVPAGVLLALAEVNQRPQVQLNRNLGQRLAAHQCNQPLGERAFIFMWVMFIQKIGDHQGQHAVAQELQPLVGWFATPRGASVCERDPGQFRIVELVL